MQNSVGDDFAKSNKWDHQLVRRCRNERRYGGELEEDRNLQLRSTFQESSMMLESSDGFIARHVTLVPISSRSIVNVSVLVTMLPLIDKLCEMRNKKQQISK